MARTAFEATDQISFLLRAWYRVPEDAEDDDNPGMHRYYGYGDIRGIWTPNRNTFTAMLRPGTDKTSFEVTRGYGESMIDYDYKNERIGIGIDMNDFLMRGQ